MRMFWHLGDRSCTRCSLFALNNEVKRMSTSMVSTDYMESPSKQHELTELPATELSNVAFAHTRSHEQMCTDFLRYVAHMNLVANMSR